MKVFYLNTSFSVKTILHAMKIKYIVDYADKVLLITSPTRRFCKSTDMDMIKTFLEIEVDKNSNKYSDKKNNL